MPTNDHLWTEDQAARFMQVSIHTIRKWKKDGKIGYLKINNGAVRYDPEEMRRFAEHGRVAPHCSCCDQPVEQGGIALPHEAEPNFPRYACDVAV